MINPVFEFFTPPSKWGAIEAISAIDTVVEFSDGVQAICGISGLWNASLGYGNAAIADAIDGANRNASALPLFRRGSAYARRAAQDILRFVDNPEYASVFFATSGGSALDAVVKLARQIMKIRFGKGRRRIVSLVGSYHGLTSSAMALTGAYMRQDVYDVDERLHIKVPADQPEVLAGIMARFGNEIAAVVAEPVFGSGAIPIPAETLEALYGYRNDYGFLLVADEVATGFYRTGLRFASSAWETPDILVLSKALTNGTCAASALVVRDAVCRTLIGAEEVFWHGETQAASPQSCAAMSATISEFQRLRIDERVENLSAFMSGTLADLAGQYERVWISGVGAMWGVHINGVDGDPISDRDVVSLVEKCRVRGALVQPGPGCIELLPALTMDTGIIRVLIERVFVVIDEYLASQV